MYRLPFFFGHILGSNPIGIPKSMFCSFLRLVISVYGSSLADSDIPFFTTEVTTPSSSFATSLARHLHSIGAKMYGAFWCSHCLEQKQVVNDAIWLCNSWHLCDEMSQNLYDSLPRAIACVED